MTAMLIASFFLAGSLLTMLVPIAVFIAVATWLTLVIRRQREVDRPGREAPARAERPVDGAHAPEGD